MLDLAHVRHWISFLITKELRACTTYDHSRNPWLCQVLDTLPSAFCRALDKENFTECRTR
jgi:hypothetical protein